MTAAAPQNMRQLPVYEYFQMCLFAIKIQNEKYDKVLDLNHKTLYDKATLKNNKTFEHFYTWIQDQVNQVIKE